MKRNKMFFLLLILGVFVMLIPMLSNKKIEKNIENAVSIIEQMPAEELQKNDLQVLPVESFDFSLIEEISPNSTFLSPDQIDRTLLIGQIVVPSVGINLSIFKGTTNENLLAGAATMKANDKMGMANFTLAGHYNKDKSVLFGALMDIKIDDIVKITDKSRIYEYRVYKVLTVDDTALYMISNEESVKRGNPIISLMTCYYSSQTGKRYFVLGDLVDSYPYQKELMKVNPSKKS